MTTTNRPGWRHYRHCYECGAATSKACRDMTDCTTTEPCEGRRLRRERPEHIPDDVVAAPAAVKVRKPPTVVRVEVAAPAPVVIGHRVMAFDDVVAKPTAPVRCYDDELFPFTPIAKKVPKKCCSHCGASIVDSFGHVRSCVKVSCTRKRAVEREREAARREVAA